MKNRVFILSFLISMISVNFVFAQTSTKKLSYQAVVRNAANELVVNQNLAVEITVLDAENAPQYKETHSSVPTNQNGLLWLWVGEGNPTLGTMADVVWKDAVIRSVFTLPDGSTVTQNTPVTAMPYAYFADEVDTIFLQNYLDTHDVVPDNYVTHPQLNDTLTHYYTNNEVNAILNAYTTNTHLNDTLSHYLMQEVQILSISHDTIFLTGGSFVKLPAGFSGNYHDLVDTPTNVSVFNNDAGYLTEHQSLEGYVTNDKLNDTLGAYYDTAHINQTLKQYLKSSELCDSIVKCEIVKNMRDSLHNAFDTLKYYTTSNEIDTLLGAYYDSTQVKSVISDTATALRAMMGDAAYNSKITLKKNNVELDSFRLNQQTDKAINIPVPTTVAELSDASNYVTKTKLNDTLGAYYDTANVKQMLKPYLKANELCDSIVKCDVIKDMRDSLDNAFDTLSYYYTSKKINDTLKAYYDTTHTKSVISDTATALRAMMGDAAYNAKITLKKNNVELDSFRLNQQTDKAINIPVPTTVAELSDAGNYVTKTKLNDTLGAYYDTANVKQMLKPYLKANELCDSIVKCDVIKDMRDSLDNAFDTLSYYYTSKKINDTLKAYYDSSQVKDAIHDSIGNGKITIQKNGATITDGSFYLNQKTDQTINITVPTQTSELTNNSNLAYTTGNTFSGTHDFTATTITVPSNEDAIKRPVPTTTPATECTNMNAVNVCDLLAVFDSLNRRIDALQQELDELKNFTLPVFNSLTFTDITSTTMKVKAQFTSQITPIISYKFCYSTNSDMSSPTCVDTTASEITLKGLNPFQRYYITVTASNIAGSTTGSGNERTYADKPEASTIETTPSPSGFEITVSNLHFNGPSEGTIQVFYKQGTDCAEDEEGFTAVSNPIEMVNGSTYYRRVTNLEAETPYCVLVKLSNEDSTKVYSLNVVSGAALSLSIEIDTISTISICEDDTVVITFTAKLNYSEYKNDYNYQFVYSTSQSAQRVKYISRTDSSFKMAFFTQPNRTTYQCTITANAVHKTYGSEDNLRADSVITVNKITHPTFTICNDRQIINFTRMDEGVTSVAWDDGATDNNPSVASSHLYDAPGFYNLEVSRGSCTTTKRISVNQNLTPCIVSTPHIDNSEYTPETGGLEVAVDDTVYSVNDQVGHSYQVTQIGTQCWMKSNLRTTKLSDGTNLSYGTDESNGNLTLDAAVKYYYKPTAAHTNTNYNFDYSRYNEERDGLYYNWTAAMNGASSSNSVPSNVQGICPKGWHVPSRAEWDILIGYAETTYGTSTGYANQLSGGCEWEPINELVNSEGNPGYYANANRNITGFSALPVGCIDYPSTFINNITSDARATFWTTETGGTFNRPYVKIFYNKHNYVGEESSATAKMAMSVRCLRDADGPVTPTTTCTVTSVGDNEEEGENSTITAVRDVQNHEYGVVEIGGLCWMKENLRSTQYSSNLTGTPPTLTPMGTEYINGVAYYGYPGGNAENVEAYGLLYSGNAAVAGSFTEGYQGICPDGWRLPSKSEFDALKNSGEFSLFNVVYAGAYDKQTPEEFGSVANFWSSTYKDATPSNTYLYYLSIPSEGNPYTGDNHALENSYSVRCVRNVEGGGETLQNPSVATGDPTNVTSTSATLNATITPAGNETIMTRGFQLKVSGGDYDPLMFSGTDDVYSVTVDTLSAGVTYVYRAFISYGSSYTPAFGEEVEFTTLSPSPTTFACGTSTVSDYDGNEYNTVSVGSQCWMAENLRSTDYSDGTSITTCSSGPSGVTYSWAAAMNNSLTEGAQGACPEGWHVPTKDECQTMISILNGSLPIAQFWTSTSSDEYEAYNCWVNVASGGFNAFDKQVDCFSVRCVRNVEGGGETSQTDPTVTTGAASPITDATATLGASITNPDDVTITEKGFVYKETSGATWTSVAGTSEGDNFTANLTGLTASTDYTYKAFVTFEGGADTVWGGAETFTTTSAGPSPCTTLPTFTTCENGLTVNITSVNNATSINWGDGSTLDNNPSTSSTHTYGIDGVYTITATSTPGCTATKQVAMGIATLHPCTGLTAHQTGYTGNGYNGVVNDGYEETNAEGIISVTDYDGNVYPVVQIGSQCWLAENLRCTHSPSTGSLIVKKYDNIEAGDNMATASSVSKAAHWYYNVEGSRFGILYNWCAAVDAYKPGEAEVATFERYTGDWWNGPDQIEWNADFGRNEVVRGICPKGWHLPNLQEAYAMVSLVNGGELTHKNPLYSGTNAGTLAKGCEWDDGSEDDESPESASPGDYGFAGRNQYGLGALPVGSFTYYEYDEDDDESGYSMFNGSTAWATFWLSTDNDSVHHPNWNGSPWHMQLSYYANSDIVIAPDKSKDTGMTVRCVRD